MANSSAIRRARISSISKPKPKFTIALVKLQSFHFAVTVSNLAKSKPSATNPPFALATVSPRVTGGSPSSIMARPSPVGKLATSKLASPRKCQT